MFGEALVPRGIRERENKKEKPAAIKAGCVDLFPDSLFSTWDGEGGTQDPVGTDSTPLVHYSVVPPGRENDFGTISRFWSVEVKEKKQDEAGLGRGGFGQKEGGKVESRRRVLQPLYSVEEIFSSSSQPPPIRVELYSPSRNYFLFFPSFSPTGDSASPAPCSKQTIFFLAFLSRTSACEHGGRPQWWEQGWVSMG